MLGLWFRSPGGSQDWFTPKVSSVLSPLVKSVKNEWKLHNFEVHLWIQLSS